MIPLIRLLHRIRWDKDFGGGEFALAYEDRFQDELVHIPFREARFPETGRIFEALDANGQWRRIPLHRVRQVYKNRELIWERKARGNSGDG